MRILPVFLVVVALLVFGGAGLMWFALRQRRTVVGVVPVAASKAVNDPIGVRLPFRWRYVAVPLAVLCVSAGAAAYFYHSLPTRLMFGYGEDGVGAREAGRDLLIAGLLAAQVVFAFASAAIALVVAKVAERVARGGQAVVRAAESVTSVMSNMVVLPQLILCYLTVDILLFNANETRLPSVLLFTVAVIAIGGAVLGILLLRAIQQARVVK
jgi:uncharacterized membrane protein